MEPSSCERLIGRILAHNPIARLIVSSMNELGCPMIKDDLARRFACEKCDNSALNAGIDVRYNQIVMCSNREWTKDAFESTLLHELVHLYDRCRSHVDFESRVAHLACAEIRAANLVDCADVAFASRETCVKRRAIASIAAVKSMDKMQIAQVVDEVFSKCYNDLEPIGRITYSQRCKYLAENDLRPVRNKS